MPKSKTLKTLAWSVERTQDATAKRNVTHIVGNVHITGGNPAFESLVEVDGSISISGDVRSVSFPALERVTGDLCAGECPELSMLRLPVLRGVGGDFRVMQAAVKTVDVPRLEACRFFVVALCPDVSRVNAPSLAECHGNCVISQVPSLASLNLPALELVEGELAIEAAVALSLPALVEVGERTHASVTAFDAPMLVREGERIREPGPPEEDECEEHPYCPRCSPEPAEPIEVEPVRAVTLRGER